MRILTIDWETYWAVGYTLSSMPIEAYVRHPDYREHGVGVKIDNGPSRWFSHDHVPSVMAAVRQMVESEPTAILCHHAQFDGFILSERYGIRPTLWLDTLSMGRALVGVSSSVGLGALAKHYGLGTKGDTLASTKGIRHLNTWQDVAMGTYCKNDVDLTYALFQIMRKGFPKRELRMIDMVIRMYTEPVLQLDAALLDEHLKLLKATKIGLVLSAGVDKKDLMSNEKFAELLRLRGVEPGKKISKTTGKEAYAFAKTDEFMQELAEHPDAEVQALAAARTGLKSTLAETRAETFLGIAQRGRPAPVYYKYSGAMQTHRLSGGDFTNYQNMTRGSTLRRAVHAPDKFVVVVIDSSNIEARLLDYVAVQEDMLDAYRAYDAGLGPDIYCVTASALYNRPIIKDVDIEERQVGKIIKLGLGYGMGPDKLYVTAMQQRVPLTPQMAVQAVSFYRSSVSMVPRLWRRMEDAFRYMRSGVEHPIDARGILMTCKDGFVLPSGLKIMYPDLQQDGNGWTYMSGRYGKRVSIYGGKGVENAIQGLARDVVMNQTLELSTRYKAALSSHDEAGLVVLEQMAPACMADALQVFRTPPTWAPDLPLNAAAGFARRYGEAKK